MGSPRDHHHLPIVEHLLGLYLWVVILAAVFSMLASFGVLDTRNRMVWTIGDFLYRVTEPVLRPIRNMLPNFGGIDISPLIVLAADPAGHRADAAEPLYSDRARRQLAAR